MRALILSALTLPTLASAATCPNATDLVTIGPAAAIGSTLYSSDDYPQTCGSLGGADEAYEFVAPVDGRYTFDTFGSSYDTALQLIADDCSTTIECGDDAGGTLESEVQIDLLAGERILVVVGGFSTNVGDYVLNVSAGPLPNLDCDVDDDAGSLTGFDVLSVDTCGMGDDHNSSCGADLGGEDALLTWTAPSTGLFTFSTAGTEFDTVLSLAGDTCDPELACNDDTSGLQSSVSAFLLAGEVVTLRVDGFSDSSCGVARVHVLDDTCIDENLNARCDRDDAFLSIGTAVAGSTVDLEVTNALPNSDVTFLWAKYRSTTPVRCHPLSPEDCLYLRNPRTVTTVTADANGRASLTLPVSPRFVGDFVYAQALSTTATNARATDVVSTVVQ